MFLFFPFLVTRGNLKQLANTSIQKPTLLNTQPSWFELLQQTLLWSETRDLQSFSFFIFRLGAYWLRQVLDFAVLFHQAVFPMLSGQAYCVVNRFFFTWIRGVMLDFDFKVSCTPESLTQQCHAHHRVWLCSVRPSDMTPRKVMHTAVSICTKPE